MTHPESDTLLKFVLRILDEPEDAIVRKHISACTQCEEQATKIAGEVKRLGDVRLQFAIPAPPGLPRKYHIASAVWKVAAALVIGFLMGYMTSRLLEPVRSISVPQRLIPTQVAVPTSGYIPCQAVDLKPILPG